MHGFLNGRFVDLDIGVRPQLYNRVYTLTDADPFTKEFYSETLGSPLAVRCSPVNTHARKMHGLQMVHVCGESTEISRTCVRACVLCCGRCSRRW